MSTDPFSAAVDSLIAPARNCFPIVPHDDHPLLSLPKAIYVGSGGNLTLRAVDSAQDVTFINVANGTLLDIRVVNIRATGTTASNLIGLA